MPLLRYLTSAKADLINIHTYVTEISGSANAGRNFVTKIQRKYADLAALPGVMGRLRPEYSPDMRSFAFGDHIIFFRYVDNVFEVIDILEGHRDIDSHFQRKE